jgi:integrase
MGRPAKGSLQFEGGRWKARVSVPNSKRRPWVKLPFGLTEAQAREQAEIVSRLVRERGVEFLDEPAQVDGDSVRAYAIDWVKDRKERKLASAGDDAVRLARHVLPVVLRDGSKFGDRVMRAVSKDDLRDVVNALDEKARAGSYTDHEGKRRSFGWKTAILAWSNASQMFSDACKSKVARLRVRDDNPAEGVAGPDRGVKKAKNYLYPSEFVRLVHCSRIGIRWRRLYAVAVYTYVRAGELEGIECTDVDHEHGVIHVHQAVDRVRNRGTVQATKTKASRRVPIEPAVAPLLRMLTRGRRGRLIEAMPSPGILSEYLRRHLRLAGVSRSDLFAASTTRKPITFHDLRATGITWCAIRGDDSRKLQRRAGHEDPRTTEIYIREAENLTAGFGQVFPQLPRVLSDESSGDDAIDENSGGILVGVTGFESAQRGSLRQKPAAIAGSLEPDPTLPARIVRGSVLPQDNTAAVAEAVLAAADAVLRGGDYTVEFMHAAELLGGGA